MGETILTSVECDCESCRYFEVQMRHCYKHAAGWRRELEKCKKDNHVHNNRPFTRKEIREFEGRK